MSRIIVGIDESERSKDAVALASLLARGSDAELVLTGTYPYNHIPSRVVVNAERRAYLREQAEAAIEHAQDGIGGLDHVTRRTIAETSPAKGIQIVAEHEGASLIVIGSSHRGGAGRVLAGTTAERLLHGAPCPVAVAPLGFHEGGADPIATIAVGFDRSKESTAALAGAVAIARAIGARVRIVEVLDVMWMGTPALESGPSYYIAPTDIETAARQRLTEFAGELPAEVAAEPLLIVGEPEAELTAASEDADLMVVGSRGYGPHRAVLLGSVSGRLVRDAACPVVVVPRGIETPLEELFASASGTHAV